MLYDPKWEVKTKPDVFSLESLIAWLEKQPADEVYDYMNCHGACLLDQYGAAMAVPRNSATYRQLDRAFDGGGGYFIACGHPRTFGAALTRARKALAQ